MMWYGQLMWSADKRRHKGQAQDADSLGPKGTWSGPEAPNSSGAVVVPPAERRDLTHTVTAAERG